MRRPDDAAIDEIEIDRLAREQELVAGYREAARRALAFARRYRTEDGSAGGARERACIDQAQIWRRAVRATHAGLPATALREGARPGLARARPDDAAAASKADGGQKTG
jgi:hypothetical protein